MLDIVQIQNGSDLGLASSDIPKAANVLSVQLGELEYEPAFGIDKKYFLTNDISFQKESFKAYCVRRLTESRISVVDVIEFLGALSSKNTFKIGTQTETIRGLIR